MWKFTEVCEKSIIIIYDSRLMNVTVILQLLILSCIHEYKFVYILLFSSKSKFNKM